MQMKNTEIKPTICHNNNTNNNNNKWVKSFLRLLHVTFELKKHVGDNF
jgi:hypothetical protein